MPNFHQQRWICQWPAPQQLCQWFMKASFHLPFRLVSWPASLVIIFSTLSFSFAPLFGAPILGFSGENVGEAMQVGWTLFGTSFCEISKVDSLVGVGHKWIRSFGTFWDSRVSFRICWSDRFGRFGQPTKSIIVLWKTSIEARETKKHVWWLQAIPRVCLSVGLAIPNLRAPIKCDLLLCLCCPNQSGCYALGHPTYLKNCHGAARNQQRHFSKQFRARELSNRPTHHLSSFSTCHFSSLSNPHSSPFQSFHSSPFHRSFHSSRFQHCPLLRSTLLRLRSTLLRSNLQTWPSRTNHCPVVTPEIGITGIPAPQLVVIDGENYFLNRWISGTSTMFLWLSWCQIS